MNRERGTSMEKAQELIEKLKRREQELNSVCRQEKHRRWSKWVRRLNNLDHARATRVFYAELKSKNMEQEQMGPIVNEQGKLSTTGEECLENWMSFYSKLYRKRQGGENITTERSKAEKLYAQSKVSEAQEETLDKDITIEEVVEAAFTLRSNTTA